jgi:hypothetical protein
MRLFNISTCGAKLAENIMVVGGINKKLVFLYARRENTKRS